MKIFKASENPVFTNPSITVGIFDGVHKGHKRVIETLKRIANKEQGHSVVYTFWPHPKKIIGNNELQLLNTLEEKIELLNELGIDSVIIKEFNKDFSQTSSYDFIKQCLVDKYGLKNLIVGHDHHFGKMREGKYETLGNFSKEFKFNLFHINPEGYENTVFSSSLIRKCILNGDMNNANTYLGYNYFINGIVISGLNLGKKIGFPTANIKLSDEDKLIPGNGVYAVKTILNNNIYNGMMNIGFRPTLNLSNSELSIEINIFDFDGDIYNNQIKVLFIDKLRNEITFPSIEELRKQLILDKIKAINILTT